MKGLQAALHALQALAKGWGLYRLFDWLGITSENVTTTILTLLFLFGCFAVLYSLLRSFLSIFRKTK